MCYFIRNLTWACQAYMTRQNLIAAFFMIVMRTVEKCEVGGETVSRANRFAMVLTSTYKFN